MWIVFDALLHWSQVNIRFLCKRMQQRLLVLGVLIHFVFFVKQQTTELIIARFLQVCFAGFVFLLLVAYLILQDMFLIFMYVFFFRWWKAINSWVSRWHRHWKRNSSEEVWLHNIVQVGWWKRGRGKEIQRRGTTENCSSRSEWEKKCILDRWK